MQHAVKNALNQISRSTLRTFTLGIYTYTCITTDSVISRVRVRVAMRDGRFYISLLLKIPAIHQCGPARGSPATLIDQSNYLLQRLVIFASANSIILGATALIRAEGGGGLGEGIKQLLRYSRMEFVASLALARQKRVRRGRGAKKFSVSGSFMASYVDVLLLFIVSVRQNVRIDSYNTFIRKYLF